MGNVGVVCGEWKEPREVGFFSWSWTDFTTFISQSAVMMPVNSDSNTSNSNNNKIEKGVCILCSGLKKIFDDDVGLHVLGCRVDIFSLSLFSFI